MGACPLLGTLPFVKGGATTLCSWCGSGDDPSPFPAWPESGGGSPIGEGARCSLPFVSAPSADGSNGVTSGIEAGTSPESLAPAAGPVVLRRQVSAPPGA